MHRIAAGASWRAIELLSDVHLSPQMPATFDAWANHLRQSDAGALFILGDLFELWIGDDARDAPFESSCLSLLREASSRRPLFFMAGNRDFLLGDAALRDAGMTALPDPTLVEAFGTRALLSHGDALCLADTDYQRFRAQVRSPAWQHEFLAKPLAERGSIARAMRDASAARQRAMASAADIDVPTALRWLHEAGASTLIHGHTHRPRSELLAPAVVRHVLSDWDFEQGRQRGDVLRWTAAGVQRVAPLFTPA